MPLGNQFPDKTILRNVERKMGRKMSGANRVSISVQNGDVTLTGVITYEHERRSILSSANSIQGVRRVVDQLRVVDKKKFSVN